MPSVDSKPDLDDEAVAAAGQALKAAVGQALASGRGDRSRNDLARELGWSSPVNLLRLEGGDDNPTLERLAKVALAYGGRLEVRFVANEVDDG